MRLAQAHLTDTRQQQTQRIDPRQILASEILAWATVELDAAVEREMAENPALEARENGSGEAVNSSPTVGLDARRDAPRLEFVSGGPISSTTTRTTGNGADWEDDTDPLERVADGTTLRDHLRAQVGQVAPDTCTRRIVSYLIECLDERGYLTADPEETAEQFCTSRATVERAVRALQAMDPAGVGARDLRECMMLQVQHLEQTEEAHPLARRILSLCWDDLVSRREERISTRLRVPSSEVRAALVFLRGSLTPHPGASFRPDWAGRVSGHHGGASAVRPDLIFRRNEAGFVVEMTRDYEATLMVGPLWKKLAERPDAAADEAMRRYIREHVDRAQTFMAGLARRGQTLRRIAAALVEKQQGYLLTGNRAFLRPLTRQTLAEEMGLDESVISRAVADKWVQLPTGDVVPLDAFFGNAHAVRDALTQLIAEEDPNAPYSDDEIADILTAQGFPLARRTVAKYRGLEKILPARLRRRGPVAKMAA